MWRSQNLRRPLLVPCPTQCCSTYQSKITKVPEKTPFQLPISGMNPLYHPVTPDETPAAPPGNQITVVAITSTFETLHFLK